MDLSRLLKRTNSQERPRINPDQERNPRHNRTDRKKRSRGNSGVDMLSLTLIETGTYNTEFLRPYLVSSTRDDVELFADIIAERNGEVNAGDFIGHSAKFVHYANTVTRDDIVDVEDGWNENRFSFVLEVAETQRSVMGAFSENTDLLFNGGFTTIITGYTSLSNGMVSRGGHIADDLRFYITDIQSIRNRDGFIIGNNQAITLTRDDLRGNGRSIQTPTMVRRLDAITAGTNPENIRLDHANRGFHLSRRNNTLPSIYTANILASTIKAGIEEERVIHGRMPSVAGGFGLTRGQNNRYSDVAEDRVQEPGSFTNLLIRSTNYTLNKYFEWDELCGLFDQADDLTTVHLNSTIRNTRQAERGDSSDWDDSTNGGRNAIVATVLKQVLPAMAAECQIASCRILASNCIPVYERDYNDPDFDVIVDNAVFLLDVPPSVQNSLLDKLERSIATHLLPDVSLNNLIELDITVELDWRNDSFFTVAVEGGEPIEFSSAGFASALTSPVISRSREDVMKFNTAANNVLNEVLARI